MVPENSKPDQNSIPEDHASDLLGDDLPPWTPDAQPPSPQATPLEGPDPSLTFSNNLQPVAPSESLALGGKVRPKIRWGVSALSWLISLILHTSILLALAAYHIEPIKDAITYLAIESVVVDESLPVESFDFSVEELSSDLDSQTEMLPQSLPQTTAAMPSSIVEVNPGTIDIGAGPELAIGNLSSQFAPGNVISAGSSQFNGGLMSRGIGMKRDLLERFGGGTDTEKAVKMGLDWLVRHQLPDGSWTFEHGLACNGQCQQQGRFPHARNAATGLAALMAFLGAGQTHVEGEYKDQVFKGLSFLLNSMTYEKFDGVMLGSWYADSSASAAGRNPSHHHRIYGQGIDTIAICEAFGMTKDPRLAEAAQLGINFIVAAQDPSGGGWDYNLRSRGDTSIVGWQMMALKSAWMSNIPFSCRDRTQGELLLDSVQTDEGSVYHYRTPGDRRGNLALTSCGLLCRMYMGMPKDNPGLKKAVERILQAGPSPDDSYVNYYATQVLETGGGEDWKKWNEQMKKHLLSTQVTTGHAAGSWSPGASYGDQSGGRLYRTAMSIMVLEVYYRYLPIYNEQAEEEAFKL